MTPERWQRVKSALAEILELPAEARAARIERVSSDDPELRVELASLLEASEDPDVDLLERPAAVQELDAGELRVGARLGPYLVQSEIGAGGMGEVLRAVRADNEYRQEVAIKLMRGADRSALSVRRFRQERQILAALSHPNIARLLDGGTTGDGTPYLVMEYIEGQPIDAYCDNHRLTVEARVRLFFEVCAAVQYAHQQLIVHRDLKPGNILVTADGTPKLLDFGIAKIVEPNGSQSAALTASTLYLLTPEYASPEQLLGQPITVASDVYSLGIVLYQLLTGHSPYRITNRSPHELGRAICETQPERPSATVRRPAHVAVGASQASDTAEALSERRGASPQGLQRALSGDLDHILLKALRKEPQQRYPSVQRLADDLRAWLDGRPVSARHGTFAYRAGKFVRRHRLSLLAAAAVVAMVLFGAATIVREAQVARRESSLADRRFESLRKLTDSLLFEFHDAIENLPGSTAARDLVVRRALEYLSQLDADAHNDPAIERDLASAYERIARIEGEQLRAHLGGPGSAERSTRLYDRALAIRRSLAAAHPDDVTLKLELLATLTNVAGMYSNLGDLDRALQMEREGLHLVQPLSARENSDELKYRAAGFFTGAASVEVWLGDYQGALDDGRQGLDIKQALLAAKPNSARARRQVLITEDWIGTALKFERRFAEAASQYRLAQTEVDSLSAADPNNTDLQRLVEGEHESLCRTLAYAGTFEDVATQCQKALLTAQAMADADPNNVQAAADLASANLAAAIAYYLMQLPREARDFASQGDAIYRRVSLQDPDSVDNTIDHGVTLLFLGRIEAQLHHAAAARADMQAARDLIRWTTERSPQSRYYRDSLAEADAAISALPQDAAPVGVH